jgi:hypothetical protein
MPDAAIIEFLFYGPLNAWELIVRVDSYGCSFVVPSTATHSHLLPKDAAVASEVIAIRTRRTGRRPFGALPRRGILL